MMKRYAAPLCLAVLSVAGMLGTAACKKNAQDNTAQNQSTDQSPNPADNSNLAPTSDQGQPVGQAQNDSQQQQQQAPAQDQNQGYPNDQSASNYGDVENEDNNYGQPAEEAQQAPPPMPEYQQPPCPGPGYLWTPGYWGYAPTGYYWVPGAWAQPPETGYLWTPGWWGFLNGLYIFHRGFWGHHIGYYGGIDYGYGYTGMGYQGGYWRDNNFYYNRNVNNINVTNIHNVYNKTVVINNNTRVSYNGPGGATRRPIPAEVAAYREQRIPPMQTQVQHAQAASRNREQFAAVNHGRPAMVAATQPIEHSRPIAPAIAAHSAAPPRAAQPFRTQGPIPAARPEGRQGPAQREMARPVPQQHVQARPAPQPHEAGRPQPQRETRPAPQPHEAARPQQHEAARPQQHEARPAQQHPQQGRSEEKKNEERPKR